MKFLDLCNERFSLRDYQNKPVEKEKIEKVLEAARLAPSAVNFQPWVFLVVQTPDGRSRVIESYKRDWIQSAPCFVVAFANRQESWKRKVDMKDFADVDLSIAIEHICLQATELGLGTCWVCNFDPATLKSNFNVPEHLEPIAIIPLGYPSENGGVSKAIQNRQHLSDIVKWEPL